jgi:hypothetical protein
MPCALSRHTPLWGPDGNFRAPHMQVTLQLMPNAGEERVGDTQMDIFNQLHIVGGYN